MTIDEDVAEIIAPDAKDAVAFAVSSLQVGVYATLRAVGARPGTTVGCDPIFPFAALAIMHAGASPCLPMPSSDGVVKGSAWAEACAPTVGTLAIVQTSMFGAHPLQPVDRAAPVVIVDAALSPFSAAELIANSDVVGVSFADGKPLSTGGGGLLLFRDSGLRDETVAWGTFGIRDGYGNCRSAPFIPGLDFRISRLLVPELRRSRARLFALRRRLAASWEEIAGKLARPGWVEIGTSGSAGFYRAAFEEPSEVVPTELTASGVRWRRLQVQTPGACLVEGAPAGVRMAAQDVANKLVWYRPCLT